METSKTKAKYAENFRRRRAAELLDMEKHPYPIGENFKRPAYAGTSLCPDLDRRGKKVVSRPEKD